MTRGTMAFLHGQLWFVHTENIFNYEAKEGNLCFYARIVNLRVLNTRLDNYRELAIVHVLVYCQLCIVT